MRVEYATGMAVGGGRRATGVCNRHESVGSVGIVCAGHGGWLQSLVHNDLMRKSEQCDVSRALGAAVGALLNC